MARMWAETMASRIPDCVTLGVERSTSPIEVNQLGPIVNVHRGGQHTECDGAVSIDAVDSIDSPLAHYPRFNTGVPLPTATEALAVFCHGPALGALVITEVNPLHDPLGTEMSRLVDALVTALTPAASRQPDATQIFGE
jgi:hypothetical protein